MCIEQIRSNIYDCPLIINSYHNGRNTSDRASKHNLTQTRLDLSYSNLTTLDTLDLTLSDTTSLNLSNNKLTHLSPRLSAFQSLKILDLRYLFRLSSFNCLDKVVGIASLVKLEHLSLAHNQLTTNAVKDARLQELKNLKRLSLNHNRLTSFPTNLCLMTR